MDRAPVARAASPSPSSWSSPPPSPPPPPPYSRQRIDEIEDVRKSLQIFVKRADAETDLHRVDADIADLQEAVTHVEARFQPIEEHIQNLPFQALENDERFRQMERRLAALEQTVATLAAAVDSNDEPIDTQRPAKRPRRQ